MRFNIRLDPACQREKESTCKRGRERDLDGDKEGEIKELGGEEWKENS